MKYNRRKALNALLFLCDHLPKPVDVYAAMKVIYFADKCHLERFGRLMFGETYIAMENGPVPSGVYDVIKYVGGRANYDLKFPEAHAALFATRTELTPKQRPDLDVFSRSELQCLIEAARKYGGLSFGQLKRLSHDDAWESANANGEMDVMDIARSLMDGDLIAGHLSDRHPGEAAPTAAPDERESRVAARPEAPEQSEAAHLH